MQKHLHSVPSACGEQVRYLRAVGETAPAEHRAGELAERRRWLRRNLWEQCNLTVQSLLESAPMSQDAREAWLDDMIAGLRQDRERDADRWLREAVQLRRGAVGLEELARQDSPWRPQAWLDWLEAIAGQQDPARLLRAAKEALENIPEGLEPRARAADRLAQAALALDDSESILTARWEAFRAEPFPRRLLDLRDAAGGQARQVEWMRQAATRSCDQAGGLLPGPLVDGGGSGEEVLFLEDGDCFTSGPTAGTEALAQFLAGDWRKPFKTAREDTSADWMGASTPRTFILPVIVAWLAGWPKRTAPVNVAALLDAALALFDLPDEPGPSIAQSVRSALEEVVPAWKEPARDGNPAVVNACVRLARAGVKAMLEVNYHSCVEHSAVLAGAVAEMLQVQQLDATAFQFLNRPTAKYRKHPDFAKELTARRRQMQRDPPG
ncbi:MAG: hypothetical protein FJ387_10265 [Verrucomicrobia bacterium]|nr:hypothetical protein [Verrucomicrobiota bacterium]